jgi:hypothetical protein
VHIYYIDDSGEDNIRVFSMICIPATEWKKCFDQWKEFRRKLRTDHGIFIKKEFHATEFVSGRGRLGSKDLSKEQRVQIFNACLDEITRLPGIRLFNGVTTINREKMLMERMLNRMNRALVGWDSKAICVSDEGKDYNAILRKMVAFNPIPSMFAGGETRNVLINRIIEQLFYRKSQESYFIQMADFCAYALLRSEKHLASKNALGLHESFNRLAAICQTQCYAADPRRLGIIRTA